MSAMHGGRGWMTRLLAVLVVAAGASGLAGALVLDGTSGQAARTALLAATRPAALAPAAVPPPAAAPPAAAPAAVGPAAAPVAAAPAPARPAAAPAVPARLATLPARHDAGDPRRRALPRRDHRDRLGLDAEGRELGRLPPAHPGLPRPRRHRALERAGGPHPGRHLHDHPGLRTARGPGHRAARTTRSARTTGGSATPRARSTTPTRSARPPAAASTSGPRRTSRPPGHAYDHAIVIDANTDPVRPGAGSAYFLHIGDHPTAGCVATDEGTVVQLMRWLTPGSHPMISLASS